MTTATAPLRGEIVRRDMDNPGNGHPQSAAIAIAASRQAQEVQAAMIVAKNFPRDETAAIERIKTACKRPMLAAAATYKYPRGNETVIGPSIRLAEVLAQNWGNMDFGIVEVEQREGESTVMAYAWDLETNARQTKIFQVPHVRYRKPEKGGPVALSDPRDVYELVANQGARRLRACILGVIPGDIQDAALKACEGTLKGKSDKPLIDRVRDMVSKFAELGVTKDMIEARLGHRIEKCIEKDIIDFASIYNTLKDGMAAREDFFTVSDKPRTVDQLRERFGGKEETEGNNEPEPSATEQPAKPAEKPESSEVPAPLKWQSWIAAAKNEADLSRLLEQLEGPDADSLTPEGRASVKRMLDVKHEELLKAAAKKGGKKEKETMFA